MRCALISANCTFVPKKRDLTTVRVERKSIGGDSVGGKILNNVLSYTIQVEGRKEGTYLFDNTTMYNTYL